MAYEIHIDRRTADARRSPISLSEWRAVVQRCDGVRLAQGDFELTNPNTGELIRLRNTGGDAEVFFPTDAVWRRVFRWFEGRISFRAPRDFEVPTCLVRQGAGRLASELEASLVGDNGELYD